MPNFPIYTTEMAITQNVSEKWKIKIQSVDETIKLLLIALGDFVFW